MAIGLIVSVIMAFPILDFLLRGDQSCVESVLISFGLLLGQGSARDENALAPRIMALTTLLFAILLSNILLGSLTALLSQKVEKIKIDSFKAAYENDFEILFRQKSVFSDEFSNTASHEYLPLLRLYNRTNSKKRNSSFVPVLTVKLFMT